MEQKMSRGFSFESTRSDAQPIEHAGRKLSTSTS